MSTQAPAASQGHAGLTPWLAGLALRGVRIRVDGPDLLVDDPAEVLTDADVARLRQDKVRIVHLLGAQPQANEPAPLPRLRPARRLPMSLAQARMWFLQRVDPGSSRYNIPAAVRGDGPGSLDAVHQALEQVVRRQQALRVTFGADASGADRGVEVASDVRLPRPVVDLTRLAPPRRDTLAKDLVVQETRAAFDLGRGPLMRACLLRLAPGEHVLSLTTHHIASDGWSIGVLISELARLYSAGAKGTPSPLGELAVRYGDFACWQRLWLSGATLAAQLAYWREQLAGAPRVLELPHDRPRPPAPAARGAELGFAVSAELMARVGAWGRQEGTTPFMVLLAALQTVLMRLSGQEDVSVGSPIAGRSRSEIEPLIGFFINTLVLRTRMQGDPTFQELAQRVRQVTLGAYSHQELPFEKLVEELHPQRSLSAPPLFQVLFALQNQPMQPLELPGLRLTPLDFAGNAETFDLTLAATAAADGGLTCLLSYNPELFDRSTVTRIARYVRHALGHGVAEPETRIWSLGLLAGAERAQLQWEWNDTRAPAPAVSHLEAQVQRQVERNPEPIAVIEDDHHLSYGELWRRGGELAETLCGLGVGRESLVAVCVARSVEMVVAWLGVLRAGAAYVPLDPEHPPERIRDFLEDGGVHVCVGDGTHREVLSEVGVVWVDVLGAGPC